MVTDTVILADDEAERTILASMILYESARQMALEKLIPDDFYFESNRRLFKVIASLDRDGEEVNTIAIRNKILELGWSKYVDDMYLVDLLSNRLAMSSVIGIISVIIDYHKKRALQKAATEMIEQINSYSKTDEIYAKFDSTVRQIYYDRMHDLLSMNDILPADIEELAASGDFIPTQFSDLNYLIKGFRRGDYIILAARTGVGKTAIGLNFACYIAQVYPVLFFSLEMTMPKIRNRIISSLSGVRLNAIEHGGMMPGEKERVLAAIEKSKSLKIQFSNKRYLHEIISIIRRKNAEEKLGLVVIDYVQCIKLMDIKNMQRYQIIGEISSELQALAIETNTPIIVLAQLNRGADDKLEPSLSDLRESGNLEQDARLVMFLHFDKANKLPGATSYPVDLIVKKNDSGPTGKVNLIYNGQIVTFYEVQSL